MKELRKLTEDYERRLQHCDEEWTVRSNNQLEIMRQEMTKLKDKNEELLNQNERLILKVKENKKI